MKKIIFCMIFFVSASFMLAGCQSQKEEKAKKVNEQVWDTDNEKKELRNYGDHEALKKQNKK